MQLCVSYVMCLQISTRILDRVEDFLNFLTPHWAPKSLVLHSNLMVQVTVNLEEDEIFFLLACLEEIRGLVSEPPMLLHHLQSKLAALHGQTQRYDFPVEQVSSLILGYCNLIRSYRTVTS